MESQSLSGPRVERRARGAGIRDICKPKRVALWGLVLVMCGIVTEAVAQTCVPPPGDIVSWWRAEGDGTDFADGNDGALPNGGTFETGQVGLAYRDPTPSDFSTGGIIVPDSPSLTLSTLTIEAWIRIDAQAPVLTQSLLHKGHGGGGSLTNPYALGVVPGGATWDVNPGAPVHGSAGQGKLVFVIANNTLEEVFFSNTVLALGSFTHVAVTLSSTEARIYIDGQLDVAYLKSTAPTITPYDSPYDLRIARRFNGLVDEVTLYSRALTATEIQAIYNAGSAGKCTAAPEPPTAVAGINQSIHAGQTVFLDGSASFDDNTNPEDLIYSWSFWSLPSGSSAALVNENTATPDFTADVVGTYIVQLVVEDEGGLLSPVSPASFVEISTFNLAPTAVATVDFSLAIIDQAVNFDGSASTDPEMDPLAYAWTITAAPAGSTAALVGANSPYPSLSPDLEGDYEVTLTVSDFLGPGTPDSVEVTATTASGYAEIQIINACDLVESLLPSQVKSTGNQRALCNFLQQAIRDLQNGRIDNALDKLRKALDRTDGCVLRGEPDGNGPGMDWVIDCGAQAEIYWFITEAILALEL